MQRGVAKGPKVPCLFRITEVSIRCPKKPVGWYTAYTRVYPPIHHCRKVKPIWILLKQETVSGSGISWAIC